MAAIPAPQILASGICASSPQLPCCKETIKTFDLLNGPHEIADLSFPDCRPDGYYKPKQCNWAFCHCVDANGGAIEGETGEPGDRRSVKCPGEGKRVKLSTPSPKKDELFSNKFRSYVLPVNSVATDIVDILDILVPNFSGFCHIKNLRYTGPLYTGYFTIFFGPYAIPPNREREEQGDQRPIMRPNASKSNDIIGHYPKKKSYHEI